MRGCVCTFARPGVVVGAACLILSTVSVPYAQSTAPQINSQIRHTSGQSVVPFYEGWFEDPDGRVHVSYGYVNLNLQETLDISVGPSNAMSPGSVDQGQPTHFMPGHQKGVFTVMLPRERSDTEINWMLSSRGTTMSVPSNLGPLYQIEGLVTHGGSFPGNRPPVLRFAPQGLPAQGPTGLIMETEIEVVVDNEVSLDVWMTDDGLPGQFDPLYVRSLQVSQRQRRGRKLSVTWSKYRGSGTVNFTDPSPPIEQDKAHTTVTFTEPGEYMLRVLASDGSGLNGCCWTNGYVRAIVE